MRLKEPYATRAKQIGHRLIELESCNPGIVRMRATYDPFVITAIANKLKALGFRKRIFQSSQQFLYDSFLSYQAAVETCLPYTVLAGPRSTQGGNHCWAGVGLYINWYGALAINELFEQKIGDMDGAIMMVNIAPFYDQISDLLDPIPEGN